MLPYAAWLDQGGRVPVEVGGATRRLFVRRTGDGPWTTFWHGFPTSSWDWAKVDALLPEGRSRLYLDHLGFGDADKPRGHTFSFGEQLDLAAAVWEHLGVEETLLVAHDYSVSMVQELLARRQEGRWQGPRITGVLLLNGGLFYSRIRFRPIQRLLFWRLTGPLVARLITEGSFQRAMRRVFSQEHPLPEEELGQHWEAVTRRGGRSVVHPIARYPRERQQAEERWTRALAQAELPLHAAWGLKDPVSGPGVLERLRAVATLDGDRAWTDVGHYPQVEVPDRVAGVVETLEASC